MRVIETGTPMYQESRELYAAPRHPKRWIFHPRKRSLMPPLISLLAAGFVIFEVVSRF
ncbi:MAG TPA: hypothetical protein VFS01_05275 [Rhizomicrobium sp.]|nr:hypothetical protein [Rhizomicrobium sp.]